MNVEANSEIHFAAASAAMIEAILAAKIAAVTRQKQAALMAGIAVTGKGGQHATRLVLIETRAALGALRLARTEDATQETCRLIRFDDRGAVRRACPGRRCP